LQKNILCAVMITSFIGAMVGSGINVALPSIGREFNAMTGDLSWVAAAYLFGSAIFNLPLGKAADILGRKRLYKIGIVLFSITLFIAGFSVSVDFLMNIRFLQGGLMAMVFGPGMAVLASVFDKKERGRILGYQTASVYVGLTCGPALGGLICEYLGWRWFFFLTGAVAAAGLIFMLQVKEEWYGDRGAPFDFKGSLCYMITAPLILYGFSKITDGPLGPWLFVAGLAALAMFIYVERHTPYPILDVNMFLGNRVFTCSNLAAMLHYASTFAISFLVSMYLQVICGLSAPVAGGIILLQFFMMAALSPKAGDLSDRIDPGVVASVGMAINSVGLFALSWLQRDSSLITVGLLLMVIGVGFALFSSPNNNAILGACVPKYYGTASSLLATMRIIGQAFSMAIVTIIMDVNSVQSITGADNDALLGAIKIIFRIFSLICVFGIMASLARKKKEG
jgi:MFS family permease